MDMGVIHSLKTNYKNGLQRRKIQLLNVGLDAHPINLLDAIFLLKKRWLDGVVASVILNCFRKAGFSMNLQEPEVLCITNDENEEAEPVVYTDESLLTSAPMEGEDITLPLASVTDPEIPIEVLEGEQVPVEITEVDEISEVIVPSTREAYLVLKTAQTYILSKGHEEDAAKFLKFVEEIDRIAVDSLKQTTIDNFFQEKFFSLDIA